MNQLQVLNKDGVLVTDSRIVANLTGKRHSDLLSSIVGYEKHLANGKIRLLDFFIPSTYKDVQGKERPCYLLTRKGCDMVANKMTGEKGVLFTAAYVTKFEEMERTLNKPKVLSEREQRMEMLKLTIEHEEKLSDVESRVEKLETDVKERITLESGEQRRLQRAIGKKVYSITDDKEVRKLLFAEMYREIRDRFGVASYKDIKSHELQTAITYVNAWIPRKTA